MWGKIGMLLIREHFVGPRRRSGQEPTSGHVSNPLIMALSQKPAARVRRV
jgi:hypothetical protein